MNNIIIQIISVLSFLVHKVEGYNILSHWSLNGTEQGLTLHGGPTFVEGRSSGSKAINFNQPSNCFARIPKIEIRGRSFTIAAWIRVMSLDRTQHFFSDWYSPWQFYMGIFNSGKLCFERHSNAQPWFSVVTTEVIELGKWTHTAVAWDQDVGVVKLFIDGRESGKRVFSTATVWKPPTKGTYEIGDDGHPINLQFVGSVMDLYIIEGVLNSEQLNKLRGFLQITSSINNTVVYTNETVTCEADGSPIPYVAWVRLGVVLENKTSPAEITITENNGEYVCVASNREGIKKLIVKAKAPLQLCYDHLIITDVSRAANHIFQSSQVESDVSDIDLSKWYRILSPAGNQLPTTCVPQNRCGTQAPGWLNGALPSVQDGIVKKTVCFHFNGACCYQNATVHIRKCFGFYVYKFSAVPKQLPAPRYCIQNEHIDTRDCPYFTFATSESSREGLVGHVMYSEAEVQKDLICLNYCIIFNNCKSFNYSKEKKICEINNATRQEYPEAFVKNNAFAYYEKLFTTIN